MLLVFFILIFGISQLAGISSGKSDIPTLPDRRSFVPVAPAWCLQSARDGKRRGLASWIVAFPADHHLTLRSVRKSLHTTTGTIQGFHRRTPLEAPLE